MTAIKRRISAILAADIVRYSELVTHDEEGTVQRLAVYRAAFKEVTERHGGRIVNAVGDAVLAEFPSSVDAVRCAIDVLKGVKANNEDYPPPQRMNIRIGITLADVVDRDSELFGDGVNMAARLEGLAVPGGICVSRSVFEHVANKLPVKFEDIGERQVKNVKQPVRAYMIAPHAINLSHEQPTKGLMGRAGRRVVVALVLLGLAGSAMIALQSHKAGDNPGPQLAAAPTTAAVKPQALPRFDEAKVRAFAASEGIPLPQSLGVLVPASTVPAKLAAYLGAWGGSKRWTSGGRQAILIVESIDAAGNALGIYATGAPLVPRVDTPVPPRFKNFVGTISEVGVRFSWAAASYVFTLMPDGTMLGRWNVDNERQQFDLSIVLERIE